MTAVKDQGACRTCWIFVGTTVQESMEAIKSNSRPMRLSEQQPLDCIRNVDCKSGARGPATYWEYAKDKGSQSYHSYPYDGKDVKCRYDANRVISHPKDWGVVGTGTVDI